MLFKSLNRDEPERVFIVVENNEGATIIKDQTVAMDFSTEIDGVKSRDMDTGELFAFQGIADAAISDNDFGLVHIYGYRSTSIVFQTNTSQAAGAALVPTAAADYLQSVATTLASNTTITLQPSFAVLGESIASSSASATISAKLFVRGL